MDHAGDITANIAPALQAAGFPVFDNRDDTRTREHHELIVQARDCPSWYRVTIAEIEPTDDELYLPTYEAEA
jgi:hypothetical protein